MLRALGALLACAAVAAAALDTFVPYVLENAPDLDLVRHDTGVFNYSEALTVLADDIVTASNVTVAFAEGRCGAPTPFRWTPYRVYADWGGRADGTIAAWLPVDADAKRAPRGLRWWRCTAADAWRWTPADAALPGAAPVPRGTVAARVAGAGYYVLGAAPCSAPPYGAGCFDCAPGRYGCQCEFADASAHNADPLGAAMAWLTAALVALPTAIELAQCRRRRRKRSPRVAAAAAGDPGADGDDHPLVPEEDVGDDDDDSAGDARVATERAPFRTWAYAVAASLVVAASIDALLLDAGLQRAYAWAALVLAIGMLGVVTMYGTASRAYLTPRADVAFVAAYMTLYCLQTVMYDEYMALRAAVRQTTAALMAAAVVAQTAYTVGRYTAWRRGVLVAVGGASVVLTFAYVMPLWDAPCAGRTLTDPSTWP